MGILTSVLKQTAVYWASPVDDGYGGKTFDEPIEVDCRWEEKSELFIDAAGRQAVSRATVYLGQDVVIGEYLYLGRLDDLDSAPEPKDVRGAYEVRSFQKTPDLRGTDFVRKALL